MSVDAQRTFAYRSTGGQWYVISEPTSILRTPAHEGRLSIREAGGGGGIFAATVELGRGHYILPNRGEAPEFYVLGPAPRRNEAVDALGITYILDNPEKVQDLGLVDLHAKSVAYLVKVVNLPAEKALSRNKVAVVWVGTRRRNGALSGAAGGRSFLANYISDEEASDSQSVAWAVAIAAHEQFHQLTSMLDARLPVWLAESLAHYYGLKSLLENENLLSAVEVRRRFIDIGRPVESGLLELNRRFTSGEGSVYGLFYSQGATFWHLLDMAISRATDSTRTLDSFIPELLRAQQPADGSLPASFMDALRETVGTAADDILSRYLGPAQ